MKLLFDQNISHRVLIRLSLVFPDARHVRDFNLQFASDRAIWSFAKANNYSLVTFDADFYELAALYGHPPKIVWLRFGNTQTHHLAEKLLAKKDIIRAFINDPAYLEVATLELDD